MWHLALLREWCRRGRRTASSHNGLPPPKNRPRVLVVVEGPHDIEFLRRISAMLAADDPSLPDLAAMQRRGELVFVLFGGGDLWLWTDRFAPLKISEFHLYDREQPPESELRHRAAAAVNRRPDCHAAVTGKRSLENYLHPAAIQEALRVSLEFSDDDAVADLVVQQLYDGNNEVPWEELPRRVQTRRRNRIKKRLHTRAVERMTAARLAEQDPQQEVVSWLRTIARLAAKARR